MTKKEFGFELHPVLGEIYTAQVVARPHQPNKCCGELGMRFDFKTGDIICSKCGAVLSKVEPLGCVHGRRPGQPCPHCLGLNSP